MQWTPQGACEREGARSSHELPPMGPRRTWCGRNPRKYEKSSIAQKLHRSIQRRQEDGGIGSEATGGREQAAEARGDDESSIASPRSSESPPPNSQAVVGLKI